MSENVSARFYESDLKYPILCNTFLKILFGLDTKDLGRTWTEDEKSVFNLSTCPTYILISLAYFCELITYLILRNIYWFMDIQFDESQFYSTFPVIFFPVYYKHSLFEFGRWDEPPDSIFFCKICKNPTKEGAVLSNWNCRYQIGVYLIRKHSGQIKSNSNF